MRSKPRPNTKLSVHQEKRLCVVLAGMLRTQGRGITYEVVEEENTNAILREKGGGVLGRPGVGGARARRWLYGVC